MNEFLAVIIAFLTVAIALAVAWIARRQHELDKNRLKLEMFDRRFAIYSSVLEQIREALRKRGWPEETDANYLQQIEMARFLFPPDVLDYMERLRGDLIDFAGNAEEAADTPFGAPERREYLKIKRDGIRRLRMEYSKVADVFEPHMSIKW